MKKLSLSTILGICAMLIGCWWVCGMVIDLSRQSLMNWKWVDFTILSIITTIPGWFAVYFGFRLIKEKSKKNIKGTVGVLAILGVLCLDVFIEWWVLPNHIGKPISFLLITIAAILLYIPVSRFLMVRVGLTPKPKGEFVGRGIISVIAVQIWLAGTEIAKIYEPKELWGIVFALYAFGPIIIAWVFHNVAMRFIKEDKAEQAEQPASSNPDPLDT